MISVTRAVQAPRINVAAINGAKSAFTTCRIGDGFQRRFYQIAEHNPTIQAKVHRPPTGSHRWSTARNPSVDLENTHQRQEFADKTAGSGKPTLAIVKNMNTKA